MGARCVGGMAPIVFGRKEEEAGGEVERRNATENLNNSERYSIRPGRIPVHVPTDFTFRLNVDRRLNYSS